jgi:alpha-glucosidase
MQRERFILACAALLIIAPALITANEYNLHSPDGTLRLKVETSGQVTFSVYHNSTLILAPSLLSMTLRNHFRLGLDPVVREEKRRSVDEVIHPVVPQKTAVIPDRYEELTLSFEGDYALTFRAYDDGAAYRFSTDLDGDIDVLTEEVRVNFPADHPVWFPTEPGFFSHQERLFELLPLSEIPPEKMCYPPALVVPADGPRIAITEADLEDYPGLYLSGTGSPALVGTFPAAAAREERLRARDIQVAERHDYLARTAGRRSFPWRVLLIADNDGALIENQLVYQLAKPIQIDDPSWIKPGKVAWDWWNALNLRGVDFEAGINTATYKYYIDFAANHNIEYVILDAGWSVYEDLHTINPDIDMEAILRHARKRDVGIILWVVWKTLDEQLETAMDQFEQWGVKGIKVDYMQRDDQWMVNYYHRIAEEAARRKLLVDFHGAYKPTGLRRAWPNVLTREGVQGLEHSKWSENVTPEHDLIIPFTRMLAGPMDYTPGAMINAQKDNFRIIFTRAMSQGTRCHQLAMYIVYESPLQMLCDSPSNYLAEQECLGFITSVPTVWDDTRVLDAKVSDYILIARRSGETWYLGAMTDWTPRNLNLDLAFLGKGKYTMEIFADGANAHRHGNDYRRDIRTVSRRDRLMIHMAPGGGWAAILEPK